ncbi:MAG: hypothetical protein SynsKO_25850 [Synoicihabitans sp.]
MPAARRTLLVLGLSAALAPFGSFAQSDAADPATDYRELLRREAGLIPGTENGEFFTEIVQLKASLSGLNDYEATIAVREDLAELIKGTGQSAAAIAQLRSAASFALAAADAPTALRLYLAQLDLYVPHADAERGIPVAEESIRLAQALGDHSAWVTAALAKISLRDASNASTDFESTYDSLLALEGADEFAIKLHRVRRNSSPVEDDLAERRWLEVKRMAIARQLPAIEAEAWEALAWMAYHRNDFDLAAHRFRSGDALDFPQGRTAQNWGLYIRLFEQLGNSAHALAIVQGKLAEDPGRQDPGFRAELQDGLALLLATEGDYPAAYAALREAADLRAAQDYTPQFLPLATMTRGNIPAVTDAVSVDAAIRAAQREADLALAKSHRQFLIAAVVAALLLIALLTLAYRLKRRAAAAAVLSREAAELRAENARLLALRYQLNPHFLFNALEGLRSRFTENAHAGISLLDRLTEFCRLVFTLRKDGLQTVEDECAMIEAFLRIEQDRWEDNLVVNLDFDPAARAKTLPTMLIQPLVENALKYGAETSTDRITIGVTTRVEDPDTLVITIANSGHWLKETALRERSSNRIGLNNIRRRLASYYPDRHTFDIGPSAAGVTAILILKGQPHQPS